MKLWILDKDGNKIELASENQIKLHFTTMVYGICEKCGREFSRQYRNKPYALRPICPTCLTKEKWFNKYGVEYAFQSEYVKSKIKQTWLKKYGVDNPYKSEEIKQKIKQSLLERYGVDAPMKNKEILEKSKKTNLKKYGVERPLQSDKIKEKARQTCLRKYGVDNPAKSNEIKRKFVATNRKKFLEILFNGDRLKGKVKPLFKFEEYNDIKKEYKWQCSKCNTIFEDNLDYGKIPRCPVCFPKQYQESRYELEIADWLSFYTTVERRYKISGKEIDIFLPQYNLGIEFNGLYWHSELAGNKDKNYHISKTKLAAKYGIHLIHIFEDEWIEKQEIVKSIIKNKIGKTENKIGARETQLIEIDSSAARIFLEDNHIQGYAPSKYKFALIKEDSIVAVMIINKSRFKKDTWEITRFATKINTTVIGAFSKLLAAFKEKGALITYADLRYFTGKIYKNNGFIFLHFTKPDYYYTDYKYRYNRIQFQKHKLAEKLKYFEPALTEWQNMQLNGWDRIWGCGNAVYVREL